MSDYIHFLSPSLQEAYSNKGLTASQSWDLAQNNLDIIRYIERDTISQNSFHEWCNIISNRLCDSSEQMIEDAIRWGTCIRDIGKVWPCLPSKELSYSDREEFYKRQLHYCFEYIKQAGYFTDCAIEHAAHIFDSFIQEGRLVEIYDFYKLKKYLYTNFQSTSVETIDRLYAYVKYSFISFSKEHKIIFSSHDIRNVLKDNLFELSELSRIIPENIIRKCIDEEFKLHEEPEYLDSPVPNGIDVYFLGGPRTGKSCIISGLLSAIKQQSTSQILYNPYAWTLLHQFEEGLIPLGTRNNTTTSIGVTIKDKGVKRSFNLIDIDGNSVLNIAYGMETNAETLLANDNHKILFLIIDPLDLQFRFWSDSQWCFYGQRNLLNQLINSLDRNKEFMRHVLGIHLVVTKSDLLFSFKEFLGCIQYGRYEGALEYIKDLCKCYNINRKYNFAPNIIPFSIGKFYTKEHFVYESKCSQDILDIILESSISDTRIKMKRFVGHLRELIKNI